MNRAEVNAQRNASCPCGSGKKYKKCCMGKVTTAVVAASNPQVQLELQLAMQHHGAGRFAEAENLYRQVLAHEAEHPQALHGLGLVAYQTGHPTTALTLLNKAVEINPRDPDAHYNCGLVLQVLKRPKEAMTCYDRALALKPDYAMAHNNRAVLLRDLNRLDEALTSYQLAFKFKPDDVEILNGLGNISNDLQRHGEALSYLERALILEPKNAIPYNNMGMVLQNLGRHDEAQASFNKALRLQPDYATACHNLGVAFQIQGQVEAALACYERALSLQPDLAWVYYDSMLLVLNYLSNCRPQAVYEAHRGYAERFEGPLRSMWPVHANGREPARRLKVGYVSPDFRQHSVAYFIEPILAQHDKGQVEVYCYYNSGVQDAVTARLRGYADHWLVCIGLDDAELAARIEADGIDILVDLAGHTGNNRLLVFARKPAPVQVTYLGYVATTGLTAMDYRLSHLDADPEGNERYNSEKLYRLPRSLWCYRPAAEIPAVVDGTAGRGNDHITYGSLNNIAKISEATVAVWSRLLQALPESRLIMAGVPRGSAQQGMEARFGAHGIEAGRLELHDKMSHGQFRELHSRIDIALDPFPHNGNTTTCESLYLGVPVVTLIGEQFVARFGYTLLKALGLEELAARDEAEYVAIAVGLGRDLPRLTELHATLRERFAGSVLRDEAGFTRDLEVAYRTMWREWCRGRNVLT